MVQDCKFNPTMEREQPNSVKQNEINEKKSVIPNIQELREQIRPGGQLGCKF